MAGYIIANSPIGTPRLMSVRDGEVERAAGDRLQRVDRVA